LQKIKKDILDNIPKLKKQGWVFVLIWKVYKKYKLDNISEVWQHYRELKSNNFELPKILQRVERHIIKKDKNLENITYNSKNLYNYANYIIRQQFFKTGKIPKEYELTKKLAKENQIDYREMPSAQSSQQTIKLLFKNWKAYFQSIKDYKKSPKKYLGRPKLPKYRKKEGHNIVIFTNQNCKIKDRFVYFPKKADISPIKTSVSTLKQVRIIPKATCFIVEIIYEKEAKPVKTQKKTFLSCDLGVNNFVTTFNNIGKNPFIINGRILKSINQFYNKRKAKLMSNIGNRGTSNKIEKLTQKRDQKIQDYFHKSSREIINFAIKNKISTIIIGNNENWKQKVNIGKRNNQNFVAIPYLKFIQQVQYKAEEVGISVTVTEESYTSKIDHLADEPMKKQIKYLGRRLKRGLFRSSTNKILNADVNGAIGIFRKVVPEEVFHKTLGNRGTVFVPYIINF